jgi:hypothetical protein
MQNRLAATAEDDSAAVIEALGQQIAQLQKELTAARAALEVAAVPVAQICASIRKAGASYALADDIALMAMALRDAAATIVCGDEIDTKRQWEYRLQWLEKIPSFDSFDTIESARINTKISLALLRPKQLVRLEITKSRHQDWTEEEKDKLMREQMQGDLFSEADAKRQVTGLRKIPFDFYYHYTCHTPDGEKMHKHKLVDWEVGALFWNCQYKHGSNWEEPFRAKLEHQLGNKNLMFLMGNQHRFQDQWLIISLIYPPKKTPAATAQQSLF